MKTNQNDIIVTWVSIEEYPFKEMRVVNGGNSKYLSGSRFDFGFLESACDNGYNVIVLKNPKK